MSKRIVIPIETKVREFEGKLWLALHLLQRGHEVILGHKPGIMAQIFKLEPNVFIDVGAGGRPERLAKFKKLQESGATNIVLDQEGGVLPNDRSKYRIRLSEKLLEYVDYFLTWGFRQKEIVEENTSLNSKQIVATGEPKLDLLSQKYREFYGGRADQIKNNFGDYILVNTSFGMANNVDPKDNQEIMTSDDILREEDATYWLDERSFQRKIFEYFLSAVDQLSNQFPDLNFIIRPHPSENFETYEKHYEQDDNVFVRHEGEVYPWIMGSKAVLHNNCTTAVESVLMDQPVIAYVPETNENYDSVLPNKVSQQADDLDELKHYLECAVKGDLLAPSERLSEKTMELLYDFFREPDGNNASRIADLIDDEISDSNWASNPSLNWKATLKSGLFSVLGEDLYMESIQVKNWLLGISSNTEAIDQKFSGLTEEEIRTTLLKMQDLTQENIDFNISQIPSFSDSFLISSQ